MTESGFYRIREQAIAAPFWTNLLFAEVSSALAVNEVDFSLVHLVELLQHKHPVVQLDERLGK